jgi:O-antigen biosynthesis protein
MLKYTDLNTRVLKVIPMNATILDVGCATGSLGRAIKKYKKPKLLIGIDSDKPALKIASHYYDEVYELDVDGKITLHNKHFDCIILADIMEHLKDPETLLRSLKSYLKPRGIMVISVPNILFIINRVNILIGRFEYTDKGIMDRTHLRFFTCRSLRKMLSDNDFEILNFRGYINTRNYLRFADFFAKIMPDLFAYQLLFVVRKNQ